MSLTSSFIDISSCNSYFADNIVTDDLVIRTGASYQRIALATLPMSNATMILSNNIVSFASNVGIGRSNPQYALDVNGVINVNNIYGNGSPSAGSQLSNVNSAVLGSHISSYMVGNTTPVMSLQSFNHDSISLSFGAHYNGSWLTSSQSNNYQIYKNNGQLLFNYGANATVGASFTPNTAMTINSNGYISIGSNFRNPTHFLHVYALSNDNGIILAGSSNGNISPVMKFADWNNNTLARIGLAGSPGNLVSSSGLYDLVIRAENRNIWFAPNSGASNVAAVFTPQGYLGLGLSNPSYPLHVASQSNNVSIFTSFDITAFSDARVKKNIKPITNALDKIQKISGYTFERLDNDNNERFAGVLAQEVEKVLPEVVHKDIHGYLNVAYGNLSALLIEGIKELHRRNKQIEHALKIIDPSCFS